MKSLKLNHDLAQEVIAGKKHSTWRINDDKKLAVNDEVELIDKVDEQDPTSWRIIGVATIDQVIEKRMGQLTEEDWIGHETYESIEHMYQTYRQYYGENIGPETVVKIIHFAFTPYKEQRPMESNDVKNATKYAELKIYADGGSRGNPGPSASGYVLLDMDDKVLKEGKVYLGITTNNQAEYQALKFAMEDAKKMNAQNVYVYMDSLLVVNQMKGIFKIRNRDLWPIHQAIKELIPSFKHVTFTHVPRELNKLADRMVNISLDEARDNPGQH